MCMHIRFQALILALFTTFCVHANNATSKWGVLSLICGTHAVKLADSAFRICDGRALA